MPRWLTLCWQWGSTYTPGVKIKLKCLRRLKKPSVFPEFDSRNEGPKFGGSNERKYRRELWLYQHLRCADIHQCNRCVLKLFLSWAPLSFVGQHTKARSIFMSWTYFELIFFKGSFTKSNPWDSSYLTEGIQSHLHPFLTKAARDVLPQPIWTRNLIQSLPQVSMRAGEKNCSTQHAGSSCSAVQSAISRTVLYNLFIP